MSLNGDKKGFFITSYKELSQIEDVTYQLDLGMISSKLLLHLMEEWELFLFKWRGKEKLLEEILTAFRKIIKDKETMTGPHYRTKATNGKTFIILVLIEEDLNMSEEEFISELDFERALR